jgi:Ca2+-binding RTX toxin-like protein
MRECISSHKPGEGFVYRWLRSIAVVLMVLVVALTVACLMLRPASAMASSAPIGPYGPPTVVCNWGGTNVFTHVDSTPYVNYVSANMDVIPSAPTQWLAWRAWFRQIGTGKWFVGNWNVTGPASPTTILLDGFLQDDSLSVPPYYEYQVVAQYSWNVGAGWTNPPLYQWGDPRLNESYYQNNGEGFVPWDRCTLIPQNVTIGVSIGFGASLTTSGQALSKLRASAPSTPSVGRHELVAGPLCAGKPATMVGTNGDDTLVGTDGPDVITGLGGNDTIVGLRGADVICGGAGDDGVVGGPGKDLLLGGPGADTILGGPRADTIRAGSGFDAVEPEGGNDVADAGRGGGAIAYLFATGGESVDLREGTSHGADGSDILRGFRAVFGSEHNDVLRGSSANDQLVPFAGDDRINGRGGIDAVYFYESLLSDSAGGVAADLRLGAAFGEGTDSLRHLEAVYGTPFADVIGGDANPNFLNGGEGNDLLIGRKGPDDLYGGDGTDTCLSGVSYVSCENHADALPLPPGGQNPPLP